MPVVLLAGSLGGALLSAAPAGAQVGSATLYVSTTGSSTKNDTSCSTAKYTSIQTAVTAAAPGDTVVVCAGSYTVDIPPQGNINTPTLGENPYGGIDLTQPITVKASGAVTVSGTGPIFVIYYPGNATSKAQPGGVTGVTIQGFDFKNVTGSGYNGVISVPGYGAGNVTIKDNVFTTITDEAIGYHGDAGLTSPLGTNFDIVGNTISNVTGNTGGSEPRSGIWLGNLSDSVITGNSVVDTEYAGIVLTGTSQGDQQHNLVAGNTIADIPEQGIQVAFGTDDRVSGNDISDAGLGSTTGNGKTLVAVFPSYATAVSGRNSAISLYNTNQTDIAVVGNAVAHSYEGIGVGQANLTLGSLGSGITLAENEITSDGTGVANNASSGTLAASYNYWGCSGGPGTAGCTDATGSVDHTPWLASAPATLYVSRSGTSTNADSSCATAAFSSIQVAVNSALAGDTIQVCAGTYAEQVNVTTANLTITGPASGTPAVIEPSAVACNTTDLDTSVPTAAVVLVSGVSGVTVEHLTVDGAVGGPTTFTGCASSPQNFWGVVYQNASGAVTGDSVVGFTPSPTFSGGNNNDAGIYVQSSTGSSTVTVTGNTVSGYQKNGITCNDANTTCTIATNTVTGAGPISTEAQNGIQMGFGAAGSVRGNTVADDDCTTFASIGTASGILIIQASDTSVAANSVIDSQQAIVLQSWGGYAGTAGATMTGDTVSDNQISYSSGYSSNSANATNETDGIDVAGFNFGSSTPSVSAVIQDNTVDGPGAFGQTSSTMTVNSPVGMQVGYLASSGEDGDLTVSATGNTFENWAADVMDVGTTNGTDTTTLTGNSLLSAPVGVDNVSGTSNGTTSVTTDAIANWWGSTSGPGPVGPGSGTDVSTNVSYRPWCTRFDCTSPPPPPAPPAPPAPPKTTTGSASGSSTTSTGSTGNVTSTDPTTHTTVVVNATGVGAVTVSQYTTDPVTSKPFSSAGTSFFDIEASSGNSFTSLSSKVCSPNAGAGVDWYTGTQWEPVVGDPGPTVTSGTPPCVSFTLTSTSTPSISQLTGTAFATASVAPRVTTVSGQTADATAAAEFTRAFPSTKGACPSSRAAVIATTKEFQDAASSQSLAAHLTTGTLLTPTESLAQVTATTLKDEGITTVYLVGGPLAITTTVASAIEALTAYGCGGSTASGKIAVHRLAGTTQYATAEAVAEFVGTASSLAFPGAYAGTNATGGTGKYNDTAGKGASAPSGAVPTAILASGVEFQDAQSASVIAYRTKLPLLLTPATTLSTTAVAAIEKLGVKQVVLMGGTLAVTNTVEQALVAKTGVSVLRVAGKDYTDTAAELARFEVAGATAGLGWTPGHRIMVARGNGFTDGLCGAVLENAHNTQTGAPGTTRPLLLTENPTTVGTYLTTFLKVTGHTGIDGKAGATVTALTVLGGRLAVSTAEISAMQADLTG